MKYSTVDMEHKEQVATFHNHDAHWSSDVKSEPDETFNDVHVSDATLGEFLKRPRKIGTFQWTVATGSFLQTFDPWSLFLNDATVYKKLDNYRLLRSKLNIKITINGNGFYYGRLIASYLPRHNEDGLSLIGAGYEPAASLRPHVYLDPGTCEGGSMSLPFFCPNNWIDLSAGDYADMGMITIQHLNELKHANSATGSVAVNVYAWLDDPVLAMPTRHVANDIAQQSGEIDASDLPGGHPTSAQIYPVVAVSLVASLIALAKAAHDFVLEWRRCHHETESTRDLESVVPQSGMIAAVGGAVLKANEASNDEYGQGIVSSMSSAAANAVGMLNDVPVIGKFAKATGKILGGVGKVAHIFGFSRPVVIEPPKYFKSLPVGNLANTDQEETVHKLSLDSKQELTVDPRTTGLSDVDEMAWKYIVQQEMYLETFTWAGSKVSDDLLWNAGLTAKMYKTTSGTYQFAPFSHAAMWFRHWRGTLIFRFQVVASAHHKGRLRIAYDPVDLTSGSEYNVQYNRIIDIAEERDLEIAVSWAQPRPWLEVDRNSSTFTGNTLLFQSSSNRDRWNGVIGVFVVNDLTSPNPTISPDVEINVFVRAGEDFEVGAPGQISNAYPQNLAYHPQSGEIELADLEKLPIVQQSGEINETAKSSAADNKPQEVDQVEQIGENLTSDHTMEVYMGEKVTSIRTLLKRYVSHSIWNYTGTAKTDARWQFIEYDFPIQRGNNGNWARHTRSGPADYNFVVHTPLNHFAPCYAGWRGGLRSKYILSGNGEDGSILAVARNEPLGPNSCVQLTVDKSAFNENDHARNICTYKNGFNGKSVTTTQQMSTVEAEFPYYNRRRFSPARWFPRTSPSDINLKDGRYETHMVSLEGPLAANVRAQREVSIGEDFSLFFYLGPPPMYYYTTPSAA